MSAQPDGLRPTVLIVDDDADIRTMLRMQLEIAGFEVVSEATNGAEGVWEAENHKPRFVILDYSMPVMKGDQAAVLIRGVSPASRIVAFSAFLEGPAQWADASLDKEEVSKLIPMLLKMT
jgi:CheY-like chemotaxis protein